MRRHITYANVMATIAVFVAVGGSAVAAGYLITSTKQIAPKVRKALKGKRGRAGRPGLQGLAGPAGTPGTKGDRGDPGARGAAGAFSDVLPSGLTETGWFVLDANNLTANQVVGTEVSFNLRLASIPAVKYVDVAGAPTTDCPGTVTEPRAAPGNVCFYVNGRQNAKVIGPYAPAGVDMLDGTGDQVATRVGGELFAQSVAGGRLSIDGSWAVTAP